MRTLAIGLAVLIVALLVTPQAPDTEAAELPPEAASALQAVLDAGGEVRLTAGDYEIDAGLNVAVANTRLIGAGPSTRIICDCIGDHVIEVTGAGFEASSFAVGHLNPLVRDSKYGIYVNGADRANLHDLEVFDTTGAGILLSGSDDSSVSRAYVHDTLADGVHVTGASNRVTLTAIQTADTGDDAIASVGYQSGAKNTDITVTGATIIRSKANGIRIEGTDRASVTGSTVTSTKAGGIVVTQSTSFATHGSTHVTVSGNTVTDANTYDSPTNTHHSLWAYSNSASYPTSHVIFDGNLVQGGGSAFGQAGSSSADATSVIVFSDNIGVGNLNRAGFGAERTDTVSFTGNISQDAAGHGISIAANTTGPVLVTNNLVLEAGQVALTAHGIIVVGAGPQATIALNRVRDLDGLTDDLIYICTLVTYILEHNDGWARCS